MKRMKIGVCLVVFLCALMSMTAFASNFTWSNAPGDHGPSVLLPQGETSSKGSYEAYARGDIISSGTVEIINEQNGDITISIETYAHRSMDKISHTVFLDRWDDENDDWVQVGYWEFEKEKSNNENLTNLRTSFTVSGYPVNQYYRVRGLHLVELGDDVEGCASKTDGLYITKN